MILLDTDHFSVLVDGRHSLHKRLVKRLHDANDDVGLPVVSIEEQLRAWLAQDPSNPQLGKAGGAVYSPCAFDSHVVDVGDCFVDGRCGGHIRPVSSSTHSDRQPRSEDRGNRVDARFALAIGQSARLPASAGTSG